MHTYTLTLEPLAHVRGFGLNLTRAHFRSVSGSDSNRLQLSIHTHTHDAVGPQVFPPLKLHPRNSSIIVGTKVQIHAEGGPHPDVNIVYTVEHQNIVGKYTHIQQTLTANFNYTRPTSSH